MMPRMGEAPDVMGCVGRTETGARVVGTSFAAAGFVVLRETLLAASERFSPRNSVRMRRAKMRKKKAA